MPTFWSILWQSLLTSKSLHMSLTSSKMRSVSLSPCTSFLDLFLICPEQASAGAGGLRNVGAPSIVPTSGLLRPPRSNSWAEIFLTGVPEPEPGPDWEEPPPPPDMLRADEFLQMKEENSHLTVEQSGCSVRPCCWGCFGGLVVVSSQLCFLPFPFFVVSTLPLPFLPVLLPPPDGGGGGGSRESVRQQPVVNHPSLTLANKVVLQRKNTKRL